MNPTDRSLREMFDERGEGVHVVGSLADRAIERDRANRRREIRAGLLAAGVVLAVAVPIGWSSLNSTGTRPVPAGTSQTTAVSTPPATETPTSSSPSPTTVPTIRATGDPAPVNASPASGDVTGTSTIAYAVGGEYREGPRRVTLPDIGGQPWLVARVGRDGILVGGSSPQGDGVIFVLDGRGKVVKTLPKYDKAAVAEDLEHFVASDQDGNLSYHDATGTQLDRLAASTCDCAVDGMPVGYRAAGLVGTTAYAAKGFTGTSIAWDVTTGDTREIDGTVQLVNERQGLALVQTSQTEPDSSCRELRDLQAGSVRWRLCGPLLFTAFSRDGSHLLATGALDGLSHSQLGPDGTFLYPELVVVRTSDAAVVLEGGGTTPGDAEMDNRNDVIAQVGGAGGLRSLQRCSLDGSCEVVAPATPMADPDIPEAIGPYTLSIN